MHFAWRIVAEGLAQYQAISWGFLSCLPQVLAGSGVREADNAPPAPAEVTEPFHIGSSDLWGVMVHRNQV
jgi:hypothetical protein